MKKLLALLLALVMVFALVACTNTEEPADTTDDAADTTDDAADDAADTTDDTEEPADTIEATVFWYDFSDAFLSTVRDALNEELDAAGIKYEDLDAGNNQSVQNDQIDTAINQGKDLLIVNVVETAVDVAQGIADKAKAADIPVIFFNREVDDSVIASYDKACFVGTRAAEAGEMQGELAGEYIVANYDAIDLNKDGKISYIMMKGQLGNAEAEARTQYSVEFCNAALEEAGKPALVYYDANNTECYQATEWKKDQAFNAMSTALGTNPMDGDAPIEVVFANNDDAALGCVEALNAVNYNTGEGASIPVFGVDFTTEAAAAIEAGKMTGSILQSATGMAQTITALAKNVANGEDVFANTADFNVDETVNKIRVPYEKKGA